MTETSKIIDKNFIIINTIYKLILDNNESDIIYVFTNKDNEIVYLNFSANPSFINTNEIKLFKATLKKLYLYTFFRSYPNIQKEPLTVYANRVLRGMTQADVAKLLGMPLLEYQKVEIGISTKYDSYTYRKALNVSWKEFYIDGEIFEEVKSERT